MYPHERSLVAKFKDRPFALLGVYTARRAAEKEEVKTLVERGEITWRFWWDGANGPIANAWDIEYLPTIYLIDHKGVIRQQLEPGDDLEKALEPLLREAEAAQAG
jgi:hypothetical protein